MKESTMFADPIVIEQNWGSNVSLNRVDAGNRSGSFEKKTGDTKDVLNIRNTSYYSKPQKAQLSRHNVEMIRTIAVPATSLTPAGKKFVRAYIVIEHDDIIARDDIMFVVGTLASFFDESENADHANKIMNNEA